ncbi:hypothetical protein DY000_02051913 [Brassica cretica]|uniref:BCD1 alpha/beta domain-containing protein n=1 Tax=Brassica cretica TaxID=69181 RepID=A0ABQ7AM90_BRACR|nr:hypothetical protein DY000_02051913 [Brassica cretica]
MKTKKGRWFRLIRIREIEIENQKRRARWRRTEALNRRSILSKRKRRPDLLTPPASSLFHWSLRQRVFANRKVAASNREWTNMSEFVNWLMVLELMQWTNMSGPLRQQLAQVTILEYPVIHVYLPSHSYDFEVIRDFDREKTTPEPKYYSQAEGAITREEKIEEDDDIDSFEPEVLDLMKQINSNPRQQVSEDSKSEGGDAKNSHPVDDNMELEFEQGLIDTYADLFPELNPGDYFNFECEFAKGFDSDDDCNLQSLAATDLDIDGLEEGEIVE